MATHGIPSVYSRTNDFEHFHFLPSARLARPLPILQKLRSEEQLQWPSLPPFSTLKNLYAMSEPGGGPEAGSINVQLPFFIIITVGSVIPLIDIFNITLRNYSATYKPVHDSVIRAATVVSQVPVIHSFLNPVTIGLLIGSAFVAFIVGYGYRRHREIAEGAVVEKLHETAMSARVPLAPRLAAVQELAALGEVVNLALIVEEDAVPGELRVAALRGLQQAKERSARPVIGLLKKRLPYLLRMRTFHSIFVWKSSGLFLP